ncbi:uracil-DNA glycosylase [Gillisia limnaea]|uniref:Uracil-DNA glycosylase n=1 Tax=Gillisia limnaea (strain DSM 15749 / LMG 21470 / R-8282) TaxID=865937 RepID=H2BZA1_GILLR|nr:uracil-DNA glycosylase [Gillisia limnaea]EHQ01230.1 Uracil-DNA glycosylase [Gillisia limnaea DSM 15749]
MKVNIHKSWKKVLKSEIEKPYFQELVEFVNEEYQEYICFPEKDSIFEAFNRATFENVKVVILGQDPYHGPNQAHGLSFSVLEEAKIPQSLKNIYKEIEADLGNHSAINGNLEHWADQGVLMLNAVLTVRAHEAGSHKKKGWEKFTDRVIEIISEEKEEVVFMLWGGPAQKKATKIDGFKHLVLNSGHPSPLSAIRGHWFGNKHFSKTNEYLIAHGKTPIRW